MLSEKEDCTKVSIMSELLPYESAARLLLQNIPAPRRKSVPLSKALGRVIAEGVEADQNIPAFNKSVMDGYAVRSEDVIQPPVTLRIVGEIPAGCPPDFKLGPGQTASIMTGAPLPPGADAVVKVENSELLPDSRVLLLAGTGPGENVAVTGCEVSSGDTVIESRTLLGPAQIGVLAIFGKAEVEVLDAPQVGILPTGSEVIEITESPGIGQIRNSNAAMLGAQSRRLGLSPTEYSIVGDDVDATRLAIRSGLEEVDLLVLTGGVSMGRHDYVPEVLKKEGVETVFHKVAIKPGKPVLFGRRGEQLVFGLPGNPVSAFVTFELFVRPAVLGWMGWERPFPVEVRGRLGMAMRNLSVRDFYAPGRALFRGEGIEVSPVKTKGSADLVAFSQANCLIMVPARCGELGAGCSVKVLLLGDLEAEEKQ